MKKLVAHISYKTSNRKKKYILTEHFLSKAMKYNLKISETLLFVISASFKFWPNTVWAWN